MFDEFVQAITWITISLISIGILFGTLIILAFFEHKRQQKRIHDLFDRIRSHDRREGDYAH